MIQILFVYICLASQTRDECLRGYFEKKPVAPCRTEQQCKDQEAAYAAKHWGNQGTQQIFVTEDVPEDHR